MATQIDAKLGRRRNSERIRWQRGICREGRVLTQEVSIRINLSPLQCADKTFSHSLRDLQPPRLHRLESRLSYFHRKPRREPTSVHNTQPPSPLLPDPLQVLA
jgi:hypothetical protein